MDALCERIQAAREIIADFWNSFWARHDRLRHFCVRWWFWVLLVSLLVFIAFALYKLSQDSFPPDSQDVTNPRPLQMLIWSAQSMPMTHPEQLGNNELTSTCPTLPDIYVKTAGHNVCRLSKDRIFMNTSDAIVFGAESINLTDLPTYRPPGQAWVFFVEGHPQWPPSQELLQTAPLFNWTMAFREDADIVVPYKAYGPPVVSPNVSKWAPPTRPKHKKKTAVWMISECEEQRLQTDNSSAIASSLWSGTERFITSVVKYNDVTLIPDCGRRLCTSRTKCLHMLEHDYFFIIVMETSPCFDHPAQLIYDSFPYDIIPVFFGVNDFTHPLHFNSFIDTSRLRHPMDVVLMLDRIVTHPRAYSDFIILRQRIPLGRPAKMCALCRALHVPPKKALHKDFVLWWRSRSDCSKFAGMQPSVVGITQSPSK